MADLKQAYRALDVVGFPTDSAHYVPRPGDSFGVLTEELELRSSPLHVLVSGQRGVGKTTELLRMRQNLADEATHRFLSTFDTVFATFDTTASSRGFILVGMASSLIDLIPEERRPDRSENPRGLEIDVQAKFHLRNIITVIRNTLGRLPILILDGLEKSKASDVVELLRLIADLECSLVVVVPISLLLSPEYAADVAEWDRLLPLPAIALSTRDGSPDLAGLALLRAVVERRAGKGTFAQPALDMVIEASGGIHRDLLTLAQQACLRAAMAGHDQVTSEDAAAAIEDRRHEYSLHLTPRDLRYLQKVEANKRITGHPQALPLIHRNLIVSYRGDFSWFDVHPLVKPLLPDSHPPF